MKATGCIRLHLRGHLDGITVHIIVPWGRRHHCRQRRELYHGVTGRLPRAGHRRPPAFAFVADRSTTSFHILQGCYHIYPTHRSQAHAFVVCRANTCAGAYITNISWSAMGLTMPVRTNVVIDTQLTRLIPKMANAAIRMIRTEETHRMIRTE